MPSVAEVVRRYGPAYLERFGDRMPPSHVKVLRSIAGCRTGALGTILYRCEDCGKMQAVARSCGDRHCPSCQRDRAEDWLARQVDRLRPCPYFLVTFTLPAELRELARAHQRAVYGVLFEASSQALRAVAADPRHLGTDRLGFLGVLHTWGRTLEYHPPVHYYAGRKVGRAVLPDGLEAIVGQGPAESRSGSLARRARSDRRAGASRK